MADVIRLDEVALGRIEAASQQLKAATGRDMTRFAGEIAAKLDSAVDKVLARIKDVSTFAGLDVEQTRRLERGLEAADGFLEGARSGAIFGPAGIVIGGLLGGVAGANRQAVRRIQALDAMVGIGGEDEAFLLQRRLKDRFDEVDRRAEERAELRARRLAADRRGRRPR